MDAFRISKNFETILCISDLQMPFQHPDAFDFLRLVKSKYWVNNTKSVWINLGDEVDFHALGRWDPDPDGYSPGHETQKAQIGMQQLFEITDRYVHFCISNHTIRPWLKAHAAGLPQSFIKKIPDVLGAPKGVTWQQRILASSGNQEVLFEHGENVSGQNAALRAARQNMKCTVIGHQHKNGGVFYDANFEGQFWAMNVGCLINQTSYAFNYAKKLRHKPTLGTGVIVEGVPHFIPMRFKKDGRWNGKI